MNSDEGIVIIGATPGVKLVVHSGDVEDLTFKADGWLPEGIVGNADSGYLIRKLKVLKPGRAYALTSINTGRRYAANCGQEIPSFNVQPGRIQYLANFEVESVGTSVRIRNFADVESAKRHVRRLFPATNASVVQGEVVKVKQGRCLTSGGTVTIPIYVPSRR